VEGEDECLIVAAAVVAIVIEDGIGFVSGRFNDAVVNVVTLVKDGWTFFVHLVLARVV